MFFICIVSRYCWEESFLSNLCLGWAEWGWNSLWEWEIVVKLTDDSWKGSPDGLYFFFLPFEAVQLQHFLSFLTSRTALCRLTRHSSALKFTRKFKFKLGTLKSSSQETTKWFDYANLFKNQISLFVDLTWNQFGIRGFQTLWLVVYLFIGQLFLCFKTSVVCSGECCFIVQLQERPLPLMRVSETVRESRWL